MAQAAQRIHTSLKTFANWMAVVGVLAMLLAALAVCVDVLCRWLLNAPIAGVEDLIQYAFAITISSFFPMVLISKENVSVRFLGNALGRRAALWLEVFANVAVLAIVTLFAVALLRYAAYASREGLTTLTLEWLQAPWWWLAALNFAAGVPIQAWVLFLSIRSAIDGKDHQSEFDPNTDALTQTAIE